MQKTLILDLKFLSVRSSAETTICFYTFFFHTFRLNLVEKKLKRELSPICGCLFPSHRLTHQKTPIYGNAQGQYIMSTIFIHKKNGAKTNKNWSNPVARRSKLEVGRTPTSSSITLFCLSLSHITIV